MVYMGEYDIEHFFDKVQESDIGEDKVFDELRSLLTSDNTAEINLHCLKLTQLLDLGTIQGLIIFDTKVNHYKSNGSYLKKKESKSMYDKNNNTDCDEKYDIYI